MAKVCSRDECPPANVKVDSTVQCFNCKHDIHLQCIGISVKADKLTSPNIRFICETCMQSNQTSNETHDMNASISATPGGSKPKTISNRLIMNEVNQLRSIVEASVEQLKVIDAKTTTIASSTDVLVNRALRPALGSTPSTMPILSTPTPTPNRRWGPNRQHGAQQSFPDAARESPFMASKRKNSYDHGNPTKITKTDIPQPKMGTKASSNKLCAVKPMVKSKPIERTSFGRAIWISRINPSTESSAIVDYIVSETSVTDKSKFNVRKLVKNGTDCSSLKFVSFKIEVNEDEYGVLNDPNVWPEDVMMRPFIENRKFGDFLPLNRITPEEKMEVNVLATESTSEAKYWRQMMVRAW